MAISVGDPLPDVELRTKTADGVKTISSREALGSGTAVLFAVPGAFTTTCSEVHYPGYVVRTDELVAKGVDTIACTAVNDAHVMQAWAADQNGEAILMLADGGGDFARALGLDREIAGMGVRSQRYALIAKDGIVTYLGVEDAPGVNKSSAEAVLAAL